MATTNNITGDSITSASKPHTQAYEDGHVRLFGEKKKTNPRDYLDDQNAEWLECSVCMKGFRGNNERMKCNFCK